MSTEFGWCNGLWRACAWSTGGGAHVAIVGAAPDQWVVLQTPERLTQERLDVTECLTATGHERLRRAVGEAVTQEVLQALAPLG